MFVVLYKRTNRSCWVCCANTFAMRSSAENYVSAMTDHYKVIIRFVEIDD